MKKNISVFNLINYLKQKNDSDENLYNLNISGELSNVKIYPSNHMYFDLKDDKAKISGVMFASATKTLNFKPVAGDKVKVNGSIKVYQNNATFQIIAAKIEKDGIGDLFIQFEKNKKLLEDKGCFEQSKKQAIPQLASKIAIISGDNSAALKDVLTTLNKRYKLSKLVVFPCLVQGNMAVKALKDMINLVNKYDFDVIILARGGGSFEDLNAFNDVDLAYTILESKTPIVTGIGHETDFTIADFVSDYRAATPTAAAIKVSIDKQDLNNMLFSYQNHLNKSIQSKIAYAKANVLAYSNKPVLANYNFYLNEKQQNLDYLFVSLKTLQETKINNNYVKLEKLKYTLEKNNIKYKVQQTQQKNYKLFLELNSLFLFNIEKNKQRLIFNFNRLNDLHKEQMIQRKNITNENIIKLNLLDPSNIISKGYSIVYQDNSLIKDYSLLKKDDEINIVTNTHTINAKVNEVKSNGRS